MVICDTACQAAGIKNWFHKKVAKATAPSCAV